MIRRRHMRVARCGLSLLSLVLASRARAQPAPAPPPAAPPAAEAPAVQPGAAPAPDDSRPTYAPPVYPAPGYPPPPNQYGPAPYTMVPAPGAEIHDGLYFRLQLGIGYTHMSSSTKGTDSSIAGGSVSFDLALGAALNSHLIVYGTLIDSVIRSPTYKATGPDLSDDPSGMLVGTVSLGGGGGNAGVVGLGGGLAYYLPSNLFLAGSLLASRLFVDDPDGNTVAKSDWGFTFEGQVGKEWWVSDNWGLGVAGQLLLGAMQDRPLANESVPTWYLTAFSVMFSASYN